VSWRKIIRTNAWARLRAQEGQALLEYALILGLVSVVTIGVLTALGTNVSGILGKVSTSMANVLNS
jgi:Flp pilus assembly pilin Flp